MIHSILIYTNLSIPSLSKTISLIVVKFDQQLSVLQIGFDPRQLLFCCNVLSFQNKLFYWPNMHWFAFSNFEITTQCNKRMRKTLVAMHLKLHYLFSTSLFSPSGNKKWLRSVMLKHCKLLLSADMGIKIIKSKYLRLSH